MENPFFNKGAAKKSAVKELLAKTSPAQGVFVQGWVRTARDHKDFAFLEINDGSCLKNLQVLVDGKSQAYGNLADFSTGSAVGVFGDLVESPGKGQKWELKAKEIELTGPCPTDYPLQKKRHSDEFLRTIAHLRPRTNKYGALLRIRSQLAQAVHSFFADEGFFLVSTPIITASDCEGAGDLFSVSAPSHENKGEFFGKKAFLTVSGQLALETHALALGKVYTFGPTFRAENSHTARHAAEFWMIEPEMAFADLADDMDLAEKFVKYLVGHLLNFCQQDMELFFAFVDKSLQEALNAIADKTFERISYTKAIEVLQKSGKSFEHPVAWGLDLQTEHERFIAEDFVKGPVFVCDYPKEIKPFYMRANADGKTVAAMDLLAPRVGEIIGGSQREERHDILKAAMEGHGLSLEEYGWYLDTRLYGSAPHSGFGMGFERFLMLVTGISNIRDVISFPRTPGSIAY
ncbi:MAG: asparagine--tRNA ligase [Desulfatibacillaceae bacterium]|nr:asparagine--tRNA ligase [Desulfatibacillaceae bacterium]